MKIERITAADFQNMIKDRPQKQKYLNKRCLYKDMTFDSKDELERYVELERMQENGEITDLERQKKFKFYDIIFPTGRPVSFVVDHVYKKGGTIIAEDVKGATMGISWSLFRIKAAMLKQFYGLEIHIYQKDKGLWNMYKSKGRKVDILV